MFFLAFGSAKAATSPNTQDFLKLGVLETRNGNYAAAWLNFTQAIEEEQNLGAAYSNRCLVNIYLENYWAAKADCTLALTFGANSAYFHRGLAHYRLGEYEAALENYHEFMEDKPYDERGYYNRGLVYLSLGKNEEAIADFNQALLHISPADSSQLATIYNDRGLAYLSLGNLQGATTDFNRAINLDTSNSRAYYNRACVCHQLANYVEAIDYFTEALLRNPNHPEALINRGLAFYHQGNMQAALTDLRQGAQCFCEQNRLTAYQQTLKLIEDIQHSLSLAESVIV
ncbi:MAG: tetratricopeptide repeat protein [Gomphosphaeria aponina SAG 52.96 = DSM 107014]|uniref:Tetratricopeptide repeat protein n=1 Tax=Gomphosphaeria aponina SAG 52.96 = DSM 107014 TaxID=1521640 RepID=A0A941GUI3_9CHRO|nr:tetratricopeptide repeat protein [Gomphosphaeria aponina SAG 52.96 = DSM 107014]